MGGAEDAAGGAGGAEVKENFSGSYNITDRSGVCADVMSALPSGSPLREFGVKLASLSILLLPAAGCAALNIMAIIAGGATWLVWLAACGSSAFLLRLLKLLFPERYPFFADSLKPDRKAIATIIPVTTGAAGAPEITSPRE